MKFLYSLLFLTTTYSKYTKISEINKTYAWYTRCVHALDLKHFIVTLQILHFDFCICSWWVGGWRAWILKSDLSSNPSYLTSYLRSSTSPMSFSFLFLREVSNIPLLELWGLNPTNGKHLAWCQAHVNTQQWVLSTIGIPFIQPLTDSGLGKVRVSLAPNPPTPFSLAF